MKYTQKASIAGLIVALGIVFGDIGTSPLYTFKAIIGDSIITKNLILGVISCIIWTLTLQTTIKYIVLTLRADNKGEGGIFSLYALIRSVAKFSVFPAMIGGVALLADGIITPSVTITASVEGLSLIPFINFQNDNIIVFIVLFIMSAIFFAQQFGTEKIGKAFGPIMLVWFAMLAVTGIVPLVKNLDVLHALNPYYAFHLITSSHKGFLLLGGIFLCTTGAEALYSDLGHCGKNNIRMSWIFVKICLILNYLGQGAWLLNYENSSVSDNPFFSIMPTWFVATGIILATMASIIASQALISGSFTLISEAIRLNLWPKLKILYTSEKKGQLYIPAINRLLYIGCVGIVLFLRESSKMEAAYGLAITICMLMTSFLLIIYMYHKKYNYGFIVLYAMVYFIIEGAFFIANLHKFFHGGYITIFIAGALFIVSYTWFAARKIKKRYLRNININPYLPLMEKLSEDTGIPKYATHLIYMNRAKSKNEVEHKVLYSLFSKVPKRADIYWFVYIRTLDDPSTCDYQITTLVDKKAYRIDFYLGFRIPPRIDLFIRNVIKKMLEEKTIEVPTGYESFISKNKMGDYRFVMIEEILSYDNELRVYERIVMQLNLLLKRLIFSEDKNFGIDASSVVEEKYPLIVNPGLRVVLQKRTGKSYK